MSIVKTPIITEFVTQGGPERVRLKFKVLDATQLAQLEALIENGGEITINGVNGASAGVFADRSKHSFNPYNGPYPDSYSGVNIPLTEAEVELWLIP